MPSPLSRPVAEEYRTRRCLGRCYSRGDGGELRRLSTAREQSPTETCLVARGGLGVDPSIANGVEQFVLPHSEGK